MTSVGSNATAPTPEESKVSSTPPVRVENPEDKTGYREREFAPYRLELATGDAISWPRSALPSPLAPTQSIAAVEAWRSGRVVFDSTPLQQAVVELDRYTPLRVRLASSELGSITVSGVFYVDRLADVDSLVFALENSLPIVVERRDDELLLFASS